MKNGAIKFRSKWKTALTEHLTHPYMLKNPHEQNMVMLRASDIRTRKPNKATILYIASKLPNPKQGSGYKREFDNLKILTTLGHMITFVSTEPTNDAWCDDGCRMNVIGSGIEVVAAVSGAGLEAFMESRLGFYNIVLVSQPSTFMTVYDVVGRLYAKAPFAIIYDAEVLWYKRNETFGEIFLKNGIQFPGAADILNDERYTWEQKISVQRNVEHALISMADIVLTVSDVETEFVRNLQNLTSQSGYTIGHTTEIRPPPKMGFDAREGILFLGDFNDSMYYNGNAIWYFIQEIYPLICKQLPGAPVPITIAGRKIPQELRDAVKKNTDITGHIIFLESPENVDDLYQTHRIFVAPHLFQAGIQFAVSKAFSQGIPVVMSKSVADSFGITSDGKTGCIGNSIDLFKKCVLSIYDDKSIWTVLQSNGLDFSRRTHDRSVLSKTWARIIENAMDNVKPWLMCQGQCSDLDKPDSKAESPSEQCEVGEEFYLSRWPDVADAVKAGKMKSGYYHWKQFGSAVGRTYRCDQEFLNVLRQCSTGCHNYINHRHSILNMAIPGT